jgi:hypothetical protein
VPNTLEGAFLKYHSIAFAILPSIAGELAWIYSVKYLMKGNYSGYQKSSWRYFMGMQYQHSFENYLYLQRVSPNPTL